MKSNEEISLIKDWLKLARENLLFAHSGLNEDYAPYNTICFLCQGSAEKYLKAYLIWQGWELRKTHDMGSILIHCLDFDPEFEILKDECVLLNEYVTEARYPGELPFESIGRSDAEEAIEAANKIEGFVLGKLNVSQPFE